MTAKKSGMISKSDLEPIENVLSGLKYGLLGLTIQVEESLNALRQIMKASESPSDSSPDGSLFPTK